MSKTPQQQLEKIVICGENDKGELEYLNEGHTDVTTNISEAAGFPSMDKAGQHFKNYTKASQLMGDLRVQNLSMVMKVVYGLKSSVARLFNGS